MLSRPRTWILGITGFWCLACTIPVVGEGDGGNRWDRRDTWGGWETGRWRDTGDFDWDDDTDDTEDSDPTDVPFTITDSTFTCTDGVWAAELRTSAWSDGGEVRVWASAVDDDPGDTGDTGDTGDADTGTADSGDTDADTGAADSGDTGTADSGDTDTDTDTGDTGTTDTGDTGGSSDDALVQLDTWPLTENIEYDPWGTWDVWGLTVPVVSGEDETGTTLIACEQQAELTFVVEMSALDSDEVACLATGLSPGEALSADPACD